MSVGVPHQSEGVWDIWVTIGLLSPFAVPLIAALIYGRWGSHHEQLLLHGERCRGSHLAGLGSGWD